MKVSIIGLGKLGMPMMAAIASRGIEVIGVDIRDDLVKAINAGECPTHEIGVSGMFFSHKAILRAKSDVSEAVLEADASFIVVPTPLSTYQQRFRNDALIEAVAAVGKVCKPGHLVVIVSTVMPGTMQTVIKPLLPVGTLLAYSPEFIALGSVIRNLLNPDWVLIGEDSPEAGDQLEEFYKRVCLNNPPIIRMNTINAEIAKLAQNCFVTTKISFANSLAEICENVPGGDARTVLKAIGHDQRVGAKALMPGLGFGGPCFPRDNIAFQSFAKEFGAGAPLAVATQAVNQFLPERIAKAISSRLEPHSTVAILGAAYKPNTDVIEESHAVHIGIHLVGMGHTVRITDLLAMDKLKAEFRSVFFVVGTGAEACTGASACVYGLPGYGGWMGELAEWLLPPKLIIDPWDSMPAAGEDERFTYLAIGVGKNVDSSERFRYDL